MNTRQAKRLAMWLNGQYILSADHMGLSDEMIARMSEEDVERVAREQRLIGADLIMRSGIDPDISLEEAPAAALLSVKKRTC